jgi:hypothetical protein
MHERLPIWAGSVAFQILFILNGDRDFDPMEGSAQPLPIDEDGPTQLV